VVPERVLLVGNLNTEFVDADVVEQLREIGLRPVRKVRSTWMRYADEFDRAAELLLVDQIRLSDVCLAHRLDGPWKVMSVDAVPLAAAQRGAIAA
jgi:hypothetical protein